MTDRSEKNIVTGAFGFNAPAALKGMMKDLLVSDNEPTGKTKLSEWMVQNKDCLGKTYISELKKHF